MELPDLEGLHTMNRKPKLKMVEVWLSGVQRLVYQAVIAPDQMLLIPLHATEEGLLLGGRILCGTLLIKIKPAKATQ